MPIWVIIYMLAFIALVIYGAWSTRRSKARWFLVGSVVDSFVLLWLGYSYWHPTVIPHAPILGRLLLLEVLLWLPYSIRSETKLALESEGAMKSPRPCAVCIGVFVTLFFLLTSGLLFYWSILHIVFAQRGGA